MMAEVLAFANALSTTTLVLLLVIVVLLIPHVHDALQSGATICLVNLANNPRTASVFSRGMLEEHGSVNRFQVVTPAQGCDAFAERLLLVSNVQLVDWCIGPEICILTGDEGCNAPATGLASLHQFLLGERVGPVEPERAAATRLRESPSMKQVDDDPNFDDVMEDYAEDFELPEASNNMKKKNNLRHRSTLKRLALNEGINLLRPNIILREYYSSKYAYPAISLGARFEFERVPAHQRDAGNRQFMFNFMGSIKVGQERDREHLRDVVNSHNWTVPIHVKMFDDLVRNPDSSTVDEYRDTLLASSFTLAPVGTADDCFRFWEAIEAGSIPIFVRRMGNLIKHTKCPDAFEDVLAANPPIVLLDDWDELPEFAALITEEQIEDLRRRMVVWARAWWSTTAATVDEAIRRALEARSAATTTTALTGDSGALPGPTELEFRTKEASAALKAIKEQQRKNRAAEHAAVEAKSAKKQAEGHTKNRHRGRPSSSSSSSAAASGSASSGSKDELHQDIVDELKTAGGKDLLINNAELAQAMQRLDAVVQKAGSGGVEATKQTLSTYVPSVLDVASSAADNSGDSSSSGDEVLQNPSFDWVHDVIVSVVRLTGYHDRLFDTAEMEVSHPLLTELSSSSSSALPAWVGVCFPSFVRRACARV